MAAEKARKEPQVSLLNPVLKGLAQGQLVAEIDALWQRYKAQAQVNDWVAAEFLVSYFKANMHDSVVAVHKEAIEKGWVVTRKGTSFVLRTLYHMGAPGKELWEIYKRMVDATGEACRHWLSYTIMLETGIPVEQIQALQHK